jgi:hypothetical protein
MITRTPPRSRNILILGLVLSVLIHLFGGALWPYGARLLAKAFPEQREPEHVETADVIHFEKRVVARQSTQVRPRPPAQPPQPKTAPPVRHVAERPVPAPPKHEIVHIVIHVAKQYSRSTPGSSSSEVAFRQPAAPKQKALPNQLTPDQIASLTSQFAHTIASSRSDLAAAQEATEHAPSTMRHYSMSFTGTHTDLRRGEGYISPISPPDRIGNTVWYYTHYIYMHLDGTIEEDDIPWPYHFPVNDDLFAEHVRTIPMQPPPPGYKPNRQLKPLLAQFFGGPPVTD